MKKLAIACHRWMGAAFCILFAWWFLSGIFMLYCGFPEVSQADRRQRAQPIDAARIRLSPIEAYARAGLSSQAAAVTVASLDSRPVYRFAGGLVIYADDGSVQGPYSQDLLRRIAAQWAGQPEASAKMERIVEPDQWTVSGDLRRLLPLWKCEFPDGQQAYVAPSGEVVQYTTRRSRLGAWLGPIPHWLYFKPLRMRPRLWSAVITWAAGIASVAALLGLIAGVSVCWPARRVPYRGPKRLHVIFGLFFGVLACSWTFSGMMSMDPFPAQPPAGVLADRVQAALWQEKVDAAAFAGKHPTDALKGIAAKELELGLFGGEPVYLARLESGESRVIPVSGQTMAQFKTARILAVVANAALPARIMEQSKLDRYDAWYRDRQRALPLPVLRIRLDDAWLYIDPKTARVVGRRSSWSERWLYHALHSFDYPWLYNHRPAWDVVVLILMAGGLALSITGVVLAARLIGRNLPGSRPAG